jgi:hypothetical protein
MKNIFNIIKRIIKDDNKVLGRWKIDYCDKKLDKKIDLSNEDHCGPCGHYRMKQIKNNNSIDPTTSKRD